MVIPAWQGRVMTSSASGDEGDSFGGINYRFIDKGEISTQFNPVGGEERFWLGPEGGPFSLYFKGGQEQVYDNWVVPAVLDTEPFKVEAKYCYFVRKVLHWNVFGRIIQTVQPN